MQVLPKRFIEPREDERSSVPSPGDPQNGTIGGGVRLCSGLLWSAFAIAVYVLSTGPVIRLEQTGTLPNGTGETIYAPLWAAAPEHTPQGAILDWYIFRLWKVYFPPLK